MDGDASIGTLQRFGGRKFIATIAALLATTVVLAFDMISGLTFRDIVLGTIGVYVAGNVAQKATAKS